MVKRASSSSQLAFSVEGAGFQILRHLTDLPCGESVIWQLDRNPLFQEKPKGPALVIDLADGRRSQTICNPSNWQIDSRKPEHVINPNYSLTIIVVDGLFSPEELQQQLEELKVILNQNGGEIFIFENNIQLSQEQLGQVEEDRAAIFAGLKFFKFELLPQETPENEQPIKGLLTQARLRKVGEHHHHEVDLLAPREDDPPGKAKWRRNIIPKTYFKIPNSLLRQ